MFFGPSNGKGAASPGREQAMGLQPIREATDPRIRGQSRLLHPKAVAVTAHIPWLLWAIDCYFRDRNHRSTRATCVAGTHLPAPARMTDPVSPSLRCISGSTN